MIVHVANASMDTESVAGPAGTPFRESQLSILLPQQMLCLLLPLVHQRQGSSMAQDAPLRSAGVHFPPPFIYVVGFAIGWLMNRVWPAPLPLYAPQLRQVVIALLLIVWLALMLGAFIEFMRARTAIIPNRAATTVVTSGPYRFTRNPMYVSLAALYLAIAIFYGSWWPVVLLLPVLLIMRYAVIAREERYLGSAFPDEYAAYCSRVRRWL